MFPTCIVTRENQIDPLKTPELAKTARKSLIQTDVGTAGH